MSQSQIPLIPPSAEDVQYAETRLRAAKQVYDAAEQVAKDAAKDKRDAGVELQSALVAWCDLQAQMGTAATFADAFRTLDGE